jgi:hypothetical protein
MLPPTTSSNLPKLVPLTIGELEVIETFLGRTLDELFNR